MINCTIALEFNIVKRLLDHEGKCRFLHGYRCALEVSFNGPKGKGEMVADFHMLQKKLAGWVEDNWGHTVVLGDKDKSLGKSISDATGQKVFYMKGDPSAENMAEYLKDIVCPKLFGKLKCTRVRLYDTPEAWVEVTD